VNVAPAAVLLAALVTADPGHSATPVGWDVPLAGAGKSFLDHVTTTYADEPLYSPPVTFQAGSSVENAFAPALATPPRQPDPYALLRHERLRQEARIEIFGGRK
jgi:hypothetical protein